MTMQCKRSWSENNLRRLCFISTINFEQRTSLSNAAKADDTHVWYSSTIVCSSIPFIPSRAWPLASVSANNFDGKNPKIIAAKFGTRDQQTAGAHAVEWQLRQKNYVDPTPFAENLVDQESRHERQTTAWPWTTPASNFVAAVHGA